MKRQLKVFPNILCWCIASFFYFLFPSLPATAQMQYSSLNISQLTVEDGLSQSIVYSIAQDTKGFMWFATFNGLDRYDGDGFVHFRHNDQDSFSLSSNLVYRLFTDSKGRLWAGTWDKGLNYYEAATRRWYHFLTHELISDIKEDADGGLYICRDEMVTHISLIPLLHRKKGEPPFRIATATAYLPPLAAGLPSRDFISLFADRQRRIYCTSRIGLYSIQFNPGTHAITFTPLFIYRRGLQIPSFLQDANTGRYYLNTADGIWESNDSRFRHPVNIHASTPYYNTFYIDNRSRLWYNSGERLDTLNLLTGKEGLFTLLSNVTGKVYAQLIPVTQDRNGTFWMRTALNGVITYADDENYFHTLLRGTFTNHIDLMTDTTCLINNKSVVTVGKNGVTITEREKKESDFFQNRSVTRCGNGEAWYIKDTMLIRYNPATGKRWVRPIPYRRFGFTLAISPGVGLNGDTISYNISVLPSLFAHDSCLWLICRPTGFGWYDTREDSFHYINRGINPENFYEDTEHSVWMSADDGIYAYSKTTGTIRFFAVTTKDLGLPPSKLGTVFCDDPLDPIHIIWLGTRSGLYRMNKTTGRCRRFTTRDGLPDDLVYSLLRDEKRGDLWLSTNGGLTCLNIFSFSTRSFSEADGLQGREFVLGSALQLKNGFFMFGGAQGLNYFHPEQIKPIVPPLTVITGFSLFGKPIEKDATDILLAEPAYTKDINVSYRDNVISLSFAGIDYRKKGTLQYRYKLIPFDKDWNYANGNAHEATYTNLDPDDYTFMAEASNTNGIWGKESEPLQVHILPLWWQTWWCKALAALAILAVLYAIYRYRLAKALEVERLRNRIASDLHDEIGSTLSAITLFSEMAQRQSEKTVASPQLLQRINETSQKVTQTMRDIVWSVSTKNDSFDKMIIHMHEHAVELLELKDYELHFLVDEKLNGISLSMDKRQHLYLIYKEALNNIIKYADGRNVWISIRREKAQLLLSVRDDGRGFDTNQNNNGNGLSNMKKRASFIGGSADIYSSAGGGCEVLVKIPV